MTQHFLNDQKSTRELMKTFKLLSKFYGLKPNISKCEVASIDSLKGVKCTILLWYYGQMVLNVLI